MKQLCKNKIRTAEFFLSFNRLALKKPPLPGCNKNAKPNHTFIQMRNSEVIAISRIPMESDSSHFYIRKIGDTEVIVENIHPEFQTEEERSKTKSGIMQILYEVFSKYEEDC